MRGLGEGLAALEEGEIGLEDRVSRSLHGPGRVPAEVEGRIVEDRSTVGGLFRLLLFGPHEGSLKNGVVLGQLVGGDPEGAHPRPHRTVRQNGNFSLGRGRRDSFRGDTRLVACPASLLC